MYACGALVWAIFASQLVCGRGHVAELGLDVCKDASSLFLSQRLGSMLLMEVTVLQRAIRFWGDLIRVCPFPLGAKTRIIEPSRDTPRNVCRRPLSGNARDDKLSYSVVERPFHVMSFPLGATTRIRESSRDTPRNVS